MNLRRRSTLRPSAGTRIPDAVRREVRERDGGCVGALLGWPGPHDTALEQDHVRASGGLGMKSPSEASNLVSLCLECHWWKTSHGREARPQLLAYLGRVAEEPR